MCMGGMGLSKYRVIGLRPTHRIRQDERRGLAMDGAVSSGSDIQDVWSYPNESRLSQGSARDNLAFEGSESRFGTYSAGWQPT